MVLIVGNNSGSGILVTAAQHGVRCLHLSSVTHPDAGERDSVMLHSLETAAADLVILAGYAKKVGPRVLAGYQGRMINTHPSLLPAHGSTGMYGDRVHAAVLKAGDRLTGATVHLVTENYDEGTILAQVPVPVLPDDDVSRLRNRVQVAEKGVLVNWLRHWAQSECPGPDR